MAWQWTSSHAVKHSHKTFVDFWLENNLAKAIFSLQSYETLPFSPSLVETQEKFKSSKERSTNPDTMN